MKISRGYSTAILLVSVALASLGVTLISASQQAALKDQAVQNWPQSLATITEAGETETPSEVRPGGPREKPAIHYAYSVQGKDYRSDKLLWGAGTYQDTRKTEDGVEVIFADDAGRLLTKELSKGQQLPIFYNPDRPEDALLVIQMGSSKKLAGLFLTGIFCVLAALAVAAKALS